MPGTKVLLTGTSSSDINKIIDSQAGDDSLGVKENVSIPKYKGTDEIEDFSTSFYANKPKSSDDDCEETGPKENAAFKAAYKTAYAAARGGASEDEAKEAAYSAVYGTGQSN